MHVAGAVFDGLDQDQVGQFDDGGLFARSGQLIQVHFFNRLAGNLHVVRLGINGATSSRVMRLTSSMASTLSGSAMARNSLLSRRETGTILWLCANSRGNKSATSRGMLTRARLIGGVLRTRPMETAMSCSLT